MPNKQGSLGRRSKAESERTHTRILDCAEVLFARCGYRGASLRDLARSAGVRPFTITHHFGSKLGLYRSVLDRWDGEVAALVTTAANSHDSLPEVVAAVVDELFDFFLAKREWVRVAARAALGEGLPKGVSLEQQGWVELIDTTVRERRFGTLKFDLGLLLITVEGILHHHVLSSAHYEQLYGRDVTDPRLRRKTKDHIQSVILALLESGR